MAGVSLQPRPRRTCRAGPAERIEQLARVLCGDKLLSCR